MYIYLDIAEGFSCAMCGACCRNDWLVTVDQASYFRNAEYFGRQNKTDEFYEAFRLMETTTSVGEYAYISKRDNGGCWFLGKDNLCRLQREAGHQHLDAVCQTFPRYPMDTERGVEMTLSFSCPTVLAKAERWEPLMVIRADQPPLKIPDDSYIVSVYSDQQARFTPLYHYFELEHHFIDIMQCRRLKVLERLDLMSKTIGAILAIQHDERFGQILYQIINRNYDFMDQPEEKCLSMADILIEHFFVNFLFKKPVYIYGLQASLTIMRNMWQQFVTCQQGIASSDEGLTATRRAIMRLEIQYGHDRKSLMQWLAK
ncbi:MAG: hypothetical protein H6Q74_1620 [Firmicutes bacterium]|nr:hypothetical protein [Bacillota bacterium]